MCEAPETQADQASQPETDEEFLRAMARGKHRKNAGPRLRRLIAAGEMKTYGALHCYCCGLPVSLRKSTAEHIKPQALGGLTVLENLALSHEPCNKARGCIPTPRAAMRAAEI